MSHFALGLFGALTGTVLFWLWRIVMDGRRHRKNMLYLDECNRHTSLAAKAKTHEEYEFHMKAASDLLDKVSESRR